MKWAEPKFEILCLRDEERQRADELAQRACELEDMTVQMEKLALEDPLTRLNNRRMLAECLEAEVERARRYQHGLSLAILDCDSFKQINDTYGHPVGDRVLREIADILLHSVRQSDVVARIGGDEFCIIFPETQPENAVNILEKVRLELSALTFDSGNEDFHITCSGGVAGYDNLNETADQLLVRADLALYSAKDSGKNCVRAEG